MCVSLSAWCPTKWVSVLGGEALQAPAALHVGGAGHRVGAGGCHEAAAPQAAVPAEGDVLHPQPGPPAGGEVLCVGCLF